MSVDVLILDNILSVIVLIDFWANCFYDLIDDF